MLRRVLTVGVLLTIAAAVPVRAARPLVDYHRLDAYFALFAPDSSVPWKPASVRLDTYTSAPVDMRVYRVDPADVLVAGSNTQPRAIDAGKYHPIASWRFTPAGGYRVQSSDVAVPIGSAQGFFVVEARRGNVGEQVWINRTRVGLISKETAHEILVYGTDLGTGRPLSGMRVSFLVNGRFANRLTDAHGIARWNGSPRPIFALAQWGDSYAFLSFLPQPPLPSTVVAVRTDSAVVHAGEPLRVAGFVRTRTPSALRPARGNVELTLRDRAGTLAHTAVALDRSGAFTAQLTVPAQAAAGNATLIANAGGGTAATAVQIDANAHGLSLAIAPQCDGTCDASADLPIVVRAERAGAPAAGEEIRVTVVRSPHAGAPERDAAPWGVSPWLSATARTGADGRALVEIPRPADGLASTYGVHAESGGATADTRVVVPTARVNLRIAADRDVVGSGAPAWFTVRGTNAATGAPAAGVRVTVDLQHGASVQQQTVTLAADGIARGSFSAPQTGSNLLIARASDGGTAMDATQLTVDPQTLQTQAQGGQSVELHFDRARYAAGERVNVDARLSGASGSALLTLESPAWILTQAVPVNGGRAHATFTLRDAPGVLAAGAAMVRDGALEWNSVPLTVDAPGRALWASLVWDRPSYAAGADASGSLSGVRPGSGTAIVRVAKGAPSGSALFADAPAQLALGAPATQDSALGGASWHPWVDSTGAHPEMQTFATRTAPPPATALSDADTSTLYWNVARNAGGVVRVPAPSVPGSYVVSVLEIGDDGRVTEATGTLIVR